MKKMLRKVLAVSLCASFLCTAFTVLPQAVPQSSITVNAANTYNDFVYIEDGDIITIDSYQGDKEEVTIPSKINGKVVENLSLGCFSNNSKITSVVIPEGVEFIGRKAFEKCVNLKSVSLPSSLKYISDYAFEDCSSLKTITIPENVSSLVSNAFDGCTSMESFKVSENNEKYRSKDGMIYNTDYSYLVRCPQTKASVTLPDNLYGVGDSAFHGCSKLTSVTIPEKVYKMGYLVFAFCTGLKSVKLPDKISEMGTGTFFGCTSLTDVNIPGKLEELPSQTFQKCEALKKITIPDSVTEIEDYVFDGCKSLKSVVLPADLETIGHSLFEDCESLETVNLPAKITSIPYSTFRGCSALKNIKLPDGVESIDKYAFYDAYNLEKLEIPKSVASIGYSALEYCEKLTIFCEKDSYAEKYAKENKIAFSDLKNYDTNVPIQSITLSDTDIVLQKGDTYNLKATLSPNNCTSKAVMWYVSGWGLSITKDGVLIANRAGTYTVKATTANGKEATCTVKVVDSLVEVTDITLNKTTAQANIGDSIYLNATVTPSNATDRTVTWTTSNSKVATVSEYGTVKAVAAGTATITAKTKNGKTATCKVTVTAAAELKNNSTISATSVTANTEVTMTGKATGGTSPYKFAYYYKKSTDSAYTKAYVTASGSAYTKNTSVSFKPTTAGTYNVKINAKDDTGTVVSKEFKVTVTAALKNSSTISATSVTANTAVTMTGKATGGTSPYKFAYYYKKSTDSSWTKAYVTASGSAYTKNTSVSFKPTTAGTYNVKINAKDDTGTVVSKEFKVTVTAALKNSSTISATSVTANTAVTMTGKATGGTSPYKFAYYYKKSTDSSWTKAYVTASGSAYTKNTSVSFKPTTAGTYTVRINAKDDSDTVVQKEFTLKVTAALKNNSTISATSVTANTAVTMTGKATGGTSPYKYAYYYKKSTDSAWTKAYVTSSGSVYTKYDSMTFTPKTAGTYNVRINVKDKYGEGNVVSKDFTVKVK